MCNNAFSQILEKKQPRRNDDWFYQECTDALKARNIAKEKLLQRHIRRMQEEYNEKKKIAKKICRAKKKDAMNEKLQQISKQYTTHKVREMYEKMKYERKGFQPRLFNVRSDTGKLLTEDEEIKERWRIYFEDALNGKKDRMEMQDDQIIWYNNKEETEAKETGLISSEHDEIIRAL